MRLLSFFLVCLVKQAFSAWACIDAGYDYDLSSGKTVVWPPPNTNDTVFLSPQSCQWRIIVPIGKYAETKLNLSLNLDDSFSINGVNYNHGYDQDGGDMPNEGSVSLYIPAGNYTMSLISNRSRPNNGSFYFTMQALPLPNFPSKLIDTAITNQQILSLGTMRKQVFVIKPIYNYTIRTMLSNCNKPDYRFDQCLVYKGNATGNGQFVAGLSSLISGSPPKFTGSYTVLCFDDVIPATGFMLITPYPNPPFQPTDTWQVTTGCNSFPFSAKGYQNAYVTDYCTADCTKYVQNVTFSEKQNSYQFTMYTGCIGSTVSLLATYNSGENGILPQQINGGQWKTLQFENGKGSITMDSNASPWKSANVRNGFFATPNSEIVSAFQDATTTIKGQKLYKYSYWVVNQWDGKLTVSVDIGNGTAYKEVFTNSTIGDLKIRAVNGFGITFDYKADSFASRGTKAKYMIDTVDSSATCSFLIVISAVLVWLS